MAHILIVDDDLTLSTLLRTWLHKKGCEVDTAPDAARAMKRLAEGGFDLVLSDMRLPDRDGLFLLQWIRERQTGLPFIVMTSYAEVQNAVAAMKAGADDYVAKPVQPDILWQKIQAALAAGKAAPTTGASAPVAGNPAETAGRPVKTAGKSMQITGKSGQTAGKSVQAQPTTSATLPPSAPRYLEGTSAAARQLYEHVALVAPTPLSVLILGASGTGKEYVARRIHAQSKRAAGPFVAIDCGVLRKELAASEFFGHAKGAFTGAVADKTGAFVEAQGGTLFLDEVGNLSYDVQVQLLRALQERRIRPVGTSQETEVDIRLVCATNEDLRAAIARGEFREDLYHRINEFTLYLPELKERGEDVLLFADFFLKRADEELERTVAGFDPQAAEMLTHYDWPGNLRELNNVVKRAVLLASDDYIRPADLSLALAALSQPAVQPLHDSGTERSRILSALRATGGNKSKAAALLHIDRKTLYNKLKALEPETD